MSIVSGSFQIEKYHLMCDYKSLVKKFSDEKIAEILGRLKLVFY